MLANRDLGQTARHFIRTELAPLTLRWQLLFRLVSEWEVVLSALSGFAKALGRAKGDRIAFAPKLKGAALEATVAYRALAAFCDISCEDL